MRQLSHALAARLSQIDYDREIAMIAFSGDGRMALGVARFAADPDNRRAEFAIAVRSDWKGRGLGYLLLARILEIGGRRGIGEIFGYVERSNGRMVELCRALGFDIVVDPADSQIFRVSKVLAPLQAAL